jgi:DNA-binding NarL/FixJ family response regulator
MDCSRPLLAGACLPDRVGAAGPAAAVRSPVGGHAGPGFQALKSNRAAIQPGGPAQPLEDLLAGVLSAAIQNSLPPDPVELAWRSLTEREREVAALMAQGLTNPAIAVRLTITLNTVRTHVHRVLRKFGCRRRYELPACLQDKLENLGIHPEIPEGPMTGH